MVGCLALFAAVIFTCAFALTFVTFLWFDHQSVAESLEAATAIAGVLTITLVLAILLLSLRDRSRFWSVRKRIRRKLLRLNDVTDTEYLRAVCGRDDTTALIVRQGLATFFDVPLEKIDGRQPLLTERDRTVLEPGLHIHCMQGLLNFEPQRTGVWFTFTSPTGTVAEYVNELCEAWEITKLRAPSDKDTES